MFSDTVIRILSANAHKAKKFQVDSAGAPGFSPGTLAELFCWGDVAIQDRSGYKVAVSFAGSHLAGFCVISATCSGRAVIYSTGLTPARLQVWIRRMNRWPTRVPFRVL